MYSRAFEDINTLARFCGPRDVKELTNEEVEKRFGLKQADVMVLFGGSILAGGDVLAAAMKNGVARKYVIVGGAGHTTQTLRDKVNDLFPDIETEGKPEAEIFNDYLLKRYGVAADYLETGSTNCGNNITNMLRLFKENNIVCNSIILCQDATMQKRMDAVLRKYDAKIKIINYASYVVSVNEDLKFDRTVLGMWTFERYLTLLMGEIPRLSDDENGYGPREKNYISHVDIPGEVQSAFERLKKHYGGLIREANPKYAGITSAP